MPPTKKKSNQPKANIFFFYGPDTYTSNHKVQTWKKQFALKYGGDFNTNEINGKTLTPAQFKNETEALPFAAEKRLTIISNFLALAKTDPQKTIASKLPETPDHSIVVFHETTPPDKRTSLFKTLKKIATIEEFKLPEGPLLTQWLNKKATQKNLNLQPQSANLLTSLVGPNLWQLNNELDKLKLYCQDRPVTQEDIKALVSQNFSESIFTLTDAIAAKRPNQSLAAFHTLVQSGEDIPRIFYMIVRHFRILQQVSDLSSRGLNPAQIKEATKLHPFVIKNTLSQSRNFSPKLLTLVYRNLLSIEIAMKSGDIRLLADDKRDLILAIEKLILKSSR